MREKLFMVESTFTVKSAANIQNATTFSFDFNSLE